MKHIFDVVGVGVGEEEEDDAHGLIGGGVLKPFFPYGMHA